MVIQQNKRHSVSAVLLLLFVTAILLFPWIIDFRMVSDEPDLFDLPIFFWATRALCAIGIVPCLLCAIYYVIQLFSKEPLIEICDSYFYDHSSAVSVGKIRWQDIRAAYVKGAFFVLELKMPDQYLHRLNAWQRFLVKTNKKMKYGDICISPERFKDRANEFLTVFWETWERCGSHG